LAKLSYWIALPFIYLLSLLPFPALYLLSDFFFLLLYYVVGYRKKVVYTNLRNSFPDKSEAEIAAIQKRFFRYFCDLFLETFKTLTISRASMLKHCSMDPAAEKLFNDFAAENKSIIIVMGHMGNWEWAGNTFSLKCKHQLYVIYHPLANQHFNSLIIKMRTRFGRIHSGKWCKTGVIYQPLLLLPIKHHNQIEPIGCNSSTRIRLFSPVQRRSHKR
jgi:Kdo2-lipid IVA lauroyltransferase/acyltransferase